MDIGGHGWMTVYEFKTVEITHDYIPWVIAVSHIDYTF